MKLFKSVPHEDKRLGPGLVMRLYSDNSNSQPIANEEYEVAELAFLRKFLKPGDIFLDIGAHEGLFSLIAADCVKPDGRVIAFEPSPRTHRRLLANAGRNGLKNIACVRAALSDEAGKRAMNRAQDPYQALNSFGKPFLGEPFGVDRVCCQTLDSYLSAARLSKTPALIKLDVEGWEIHVLKGAQGLLSQKDAPVIQVEFADRTAVNAGSSCAEVYDFLKTREFDWFSYDQKTDALIPESLKAEYLYTNLFAVRRKDASGRKC